MSIPCPKGRPCRKGLAVLGDFCQPCGGADQVVCCHREHCSADPTDTPCEAGLFRSAVRLNNQTEITLLGDEARCVTEQTGKECGLTGQPSCYVETGKQSCFGFATPSVDGTQCVPCGMSGEVPCVDRFKLCTGTLLALFDDAGEPEVCIEPTVDPDAVADQSGGPCGMAETPWCQNGGPPCVGRTIAAADAGKICKPCGSVDQPRCTTGDPCDPDLRLYKNKCIACGTTGDPVCPDPRAGSTCNESLENRGGVCLPRDASEDSSKPPAPQDPLVGVLQVPESCGKDGQSPCPGQPSCGMKLYLVIQNGQLLCSSKQPGKRCLTYSQHCICYLRASSKSSKTGLCNFHRPTTGLCTEWSIFTLTLLAAIAYPQGKECGSVGQRPCNAQLLCREGLQPVFPEGICISSSPDTLNCGSLGNLPCNGVECHSGLSPRYASC
jgi:hypothetical protein